MQWNTNQALALLHSCNVGVATPIFFMSNKLAETIQNYWSSCQQAKIVKHVLKFPLQRGLSIDDYQNKVAANCRSFVRQKLKMIP